MIDSPEILLAKLHEVSSEIEISRELYWYFLEVLPPKDVGFDFFIFQEGDDEKLYFLRYLGRYYCYLLSNKLVTVDWELIVGIKRNSMDSPYSIEFVHTINEAFVPDKYQELIGKMFGTPSAIADEMSVTFRV